MKPGYRLWIKNEKGERVFGEGIYELLILVDKLGSLNKASIEMEMSYSKTMDMIKKCETALERTLLTRKIGGCNGGGSNLTKEGRELIEKYEKFRDLSFKAIERIYNEIFQ